MSRWENLPPLEAYVIEHYDCPWCGASAGDRCVVHGPSRNLAQWTHEARGGDSRAIWAMAWALGESDGRQWEHESHVDDSIRAMRGGRCWYEFRQDIEQQRERQAS